MTIWEYSGSVGNFIATLIIMSNTDEKYHPLIMAASFATHPFFNGDTWEGCATSAGIGYVTGMVISKINWRENQWDSFNQKFGQNSEQFNPQLQEKEIGNNWVLLSYNNELTGNFEEREESSSIEFKQLINQFSDKEQEINRLRDKINASASFTSEEKRVLGELEILHNSLKISAKEKIHEIEKLNEELEIEQEHAQVMDNWYRENIAEKLSQEISLLKEGKQVPEQLSANQTSTWQKLKSYLNRTPNPLYYLKNNSAKTFVLCLGIYKTTSYLTNNLHARYQLEELLKTKIILTDEEKEMLIFLHKENGLIKNLPLELGNKEKMTEFSAITESSINTFHNYQRNKYPSLGGIIDGFLYLARSEKQSADALGRLEKKAIGIIKDRNVEINKLKTQVKDLKRQLEDKKEAKVQYRPAPTFRPRN